MNTKPYLCLLLLSVVSQAESFYDSARVRSVEPQYERLSSPRRECRNEWQREQRVHRSERDLGGALVGGIAGALIGHQIGGGHGKEAATAAGAMIGALAGEGRRHRRDEDEDDDYASREVRRCRQVEDWESRLTGYRVSYEYRGQTYTTFTREQPGRNLRVRVSIDPIE